MPEPVLVLVRDLMFASKIGATAQAINVPIKMIRDPAKLADEPGERVIVDLNQPGALEAAAKWKRTLNRKAIGFVSHVDRDTIALAQSSGIDQVLPRSVFVQQLADLLK